MILSSPVEHPLQCILQALTGQATEQAIGSRMADCLHLPASLHYLRWSEYESISFLTVMDSQYSSLCLQCFDTVGWVAGRASDL